MWTMWPGFVVMVSVAAFDAPLVRSPLDPPLRVTGGFGEYRIGHFHAGLDLGTGERVGKSVYAPRAGHVERVRASGVGYGRSIYVRTDDGRLLQFGHLDAYAPPLASYVAGIQDSTGQYEQDLWPEPGRFPVHAGQRIAWTGESGAGGPHLHFEIRRGDMAYHPQRAGLVTPDARPPSLVSLTLEPLDDTSYVERGAAPFTLGLGATVETLAVQGRVRAIVAARDGVWSGVDRMVPWSTSIEFAGERVECRFDSVSWATDMAEGDHVFDAGRVVGEKGIVLWAPAGFRPRVLVTSAPTDQEAGTLRVRPGDPARVLLMEASDVAGNRVSRRVVLTPPRNWARRVAGERPAEPRGPGIAGPEFEFASLPDGFLRVTFRGGKPGSQNVRLSLGGLHEREAVAAVPTREGWAAIVKVKHGVAEPTATGSWSGGVWKHAGPVMIEVHPWLGSLVWRSAIRLMPAMLDSDGFVWDSSDHVTFDRATVLATELKALPPAGLELRFVKRLAWLGPETLPLRQPIGFHVSRLHLADTTGVGLYRHSSDGWELVRWTPRDDGRGWDAESRRLGAFALFADTLAPRITPFRASRRAAPGPYNRWALEARLTEQGSGVDARASYFVVDGRRVASEWDSEQKTLRWRPRRAPARGAHRFEIVAGDRAGNLGRSRGRFVLD